MEKKRLSKLNILKKILSIVLKIFYNLLVVLCVALIFVIVLQRISDSNESIRGYRLFRIVSGSMVPKYNIDEVVVCKEINISDLKVGDIIVYRGDSGELNNKLIMHEIIDIDEVEGEKVFHVKGLQNTEGDPDVSANQILGKVVVKSVILSWLYALATNAYSSFFIIIVLVINVFISFKPQKAEIVKLNEHNEEKNEVEEKINQENINDNNANIEITNKENEPPKNINEDNADKEMASKEKVNENNVKVNKEYIEKTETEVSENTDNVKKYKLKDYEEDRKVIRKKQKTENKNAKEKNKGNV